MKQPVIVDIVRSPVGKKNGQFKGIRADELGAQVIDALLDRTGLPGELIDDLLFGCGAQTSEQGGNFARFAGLISRLPYTVPAASINRWCGSSQQALTFAHQAIASGMQSAVIAGGAESMTRIPPGSDMAPFSPRMTEKYDFPHQGIGADRIARKWNLSRTELDARALESHRRASEAAANQHFAAEIVPIIIHQDDYETQVTQDECIRPATTIDKLSQLLPSFDPQGFHTPGNSSPISDGASAALIVEESLAVRYGLQPKGRILDSVVAADDPALMLTGIIPATRKILHRNRLSIHDFDVIEVNEAFSSVILAWEHEFSPNSEIVNPNGGAIALGHPIGASGTRIAATLLHELERRKGRLGLQLMCIGGGVGIATIFERF